MTAEIGSDFEPVQDELMRVPARPPWEIQGEPISYVESGRQALRIAASELGARGFDQVLLPGHHCESMTQPFEAEGWTVRLLPVERNLQVSARTMQETVVRSGRHVILHAPYFGQIETPDLLEALAEQERAGVPVIVDETHGATSLTRHAGRIRFASLRKMLPVPDGAYLAGLQRSSPYASASGAADIRLEAMARKAAYVRGRPSEPSEHRQMFLAAESLTDNHPLPARMSPFSHDLVPRLDYPRMSHQRRVNARTLVAALGSSPYSVLTPPGRGVTPSHVVLSGEDVHALRVFLTDNGVYCPVHWPRPPATPGAWRTDVISIPVDHRYGAGDMQRVAALVSTHSERERTTR